MKRFALISHDSTEDMKRSLAALDLEPVIVPRTNLVAEPLSGHPDLQVFVHERTLFCHPGIDPAFLKRMGNEADVKICTTRLGARYPLDIPYNIACAGTYAFHRTSCTDPDITAALEDLGIPMVNVNQGYTKCSTLICGRDRIITADRSIQAAVQSRGLDSLLIRAGNVNLPGFDYGFIGGASGLVGDFVLFTGTIDHHPDRNRIMEFIELGMKRAVFLSKEPVIDLGSILILE